MINYFYKNKGKLSACEDSLTSMTFDLLTYLPEDVFWNVLKKSMFIDSLPQYCGKLISMEYWNRWNPQGTDNKIYVEPDVLLRFSDFDVIIEAKRYNEFQQKKAQMVNEITGYWNEFGNEQKTLYFIQVGGINDSTDEIYMLNGNIEVKICKTNWTRILDQIVLLQQNLSFVDSFLNYAQIRIIDSLINGFELHQYYRKKWLNDMPKIYIRTTKLNLFTYE